MILVGTVGKMFSLYGDCAIMWLMLGIALASIEITRNMIEERHLRELRRNGR